MTETSQTHHTDADYLRDFADMSSHGAVTVDGEPLDQDAARASSNSTVQGVAVSYTHIRAHETTE